jgi:cysteine-rich repeat protein
VQDACGEECDDGNLENGDGCNDQCLAELCPAVAAEGCVGAVTAKLQLAEKKTGAEKMKVLWKKLDAETTQAGFGDPAEGLTAVAACIYDDGGALVRSYEVDRGSALCGDVPCWSAKSTKGWQYRDLDASANGILGIKFYGGIAGKGSAGAQGKNNAGKGQTSLPTGVAAALQGNTAATVQLVTDAGLCVSATMTEVTKDDGAIYTAAKR